MSNDEIISELKSKGLQIFGTAAERKERLKKHFGIQTGMAHLAEPAAIPQSEPVKNVKKPNSVVEKIEEMKQKRDERRKKMEQDKKNKLDKEAENQAVGKMGDVEFEMMIDKYRLNAQNMRPHLSPESLKINVCVRKRPLFKKEMTGGEIDCVSVANPRILVHECKFKVDGITKYLDNQDFQFDNVC